VPVTLYTITVIANLKAGTAVAPGFILTVGEVGGTAAGRTMTIEGYPLVAKGQTYVFFLAPSGGLAVDGKFTTPPDPLSTYIDGAGNGFYYVTVGGPQGLFNVQAAQVSSHDAHYPQDDNWLPIKISGVPISQFITQVGVA